MSDPNRPDVLRTEEPIEAVEARVRRRLIGMGLALLAIPVLYALSLGLARGRALEVADCLPPGVTLESPLAEGSGTVAQSLAEREARVVNGVLVDGQGRTIAFEHAGSPPVAHDEKYTVIVVGPKPGPNT